MKGAQAKRATVLVSVAVAALALVVIRLPQAVPRLYAQAQPAPAESTSTARVQLQQKFTEAMALFDQGKYQEAKAAFEQLDPMAKANGLTLGEQTRTTIAGKLTEIDTKLAQSGTVAPKPTAAAASSSAAVQPASAAPAAQASPAPATQTLTAEQKVRIKQLEADYAKAEELYKAKKLEEAKAAFQKVADATAREKLTLSSKVEKGLRSHLATIDKEIAAAKPAAAPTAVAAKPAAPALTEAQKARIGQLETDYTKAVDLYTAKKYEGAKTAFHAVATAAARENLTLSDKTELGLRRYIGRIDQDITQAKAEAKSARDAQDAKVKALAAKLDQADTLLKASQVDQAVKLLEEWETESNALTVPVPDAQTKRVVALRQEAQAQKQSAAATQTRVAALEKQYAAAEALHKGGKLQEAKVAFQAVSDAAAKDKVTLSPTVAKGLRDHLATIDKEIAESARAGAEGQSAAEKKAADAKLSEEVRKETVAAEKARREAMALCEQGMELRRQDRKDEALVKLQDAVQADPTYTDAQKALDDLRQDLGLISPEERALKNEVNLLTVRQERDAREMDEQLTDARTLMDEDKYDEALDLLHKVATRADVGDYPATMKARYARLASQLISKAENGKAKFEKDKADDARKEAAKGAEKAQAYESTLKEREIKQLFRQAEDMFKSQKYAEAKTAVESILEIDETNGEARVFLDQIDRFREREEKLREVDARIIALREEFQATQDATIIQGEKTTIDYPKDWLILMKQRDQVLAEQRGEVTAEEQAVRDKLRRQVTFAFVDTPLDAVVDFLHTATDINFVLDQRVMAAAGPQGKRVTLSLTNVRVEDALNFILDLVDLKWIIRRGAVYISDATGVQAEPVLRMYSISDLTYAIQDFAGPSFSLTSTGGGGGGGSGGGGGGSSGGGGGMSLTSATGTGGGGGPGGAPGAAAGGTYVSTTQSGDDIATLVQDNVARDTWTGRNSITYRSGALIVINTEDVQEEVQKLLEGLRQQRAIQVSMECRFVRAKDDFVADISLGISSLTWASGDNTVTGSLQPDLAMGVGTPSNAFRTSPLTASPTPVLALTGSLLGDAQMNYFLNAMEGSNLSLLLSAPRLTVYNGQRAYIAVITQRNLVTDISVSVAPSAVGYDITVTTIQTGVVFDVRPIVSADRHYVQMDLQPSRSELIAINNYNIGSVVLPSGAVQQLSVQQPVVETSEVRTTASVPDGGTLLVGGLKFSFEQQLEHGVPVLSQIPLLNRLTTRTATVREKDNLIIMVTPRIIIQEEGERRIR